MPVAIILAAEAVPLMVMASKSSAFTTATSSIGKAFTLNSFRTGLFKGGSNLFGQLATNDFRFDRSIDYADPLISGFTGGYGSTLLESAFELRFGSQGMEIGYEGNENFATNAFPNIAGNLLGSKLKKITKPLGNLSPNINGLMTDFLGGSFIETGENILGDEIKLKLKIEKGD